MAEKEQTTTAAKALRVNLDVERYGAFAEIGAGQEIARHFFQAGRASQTIAKTMSAYDMTYSDEIYGREANGRYVCESRLEKMLEKEYSLLIRRLDQQRGANTAFFATASTVATGTPETPRCHGWIGIRFQARPKGPFNDIILHVRMRDRHRLQQQEALGILGVNLMEAAFYGLDAPQDFHQRLSDNLKGGQVYIDVIRFRGPDLKHFDNRSLSLDLIRRGLAESVLFSPEKEILHISDAFYGKGLLIQRGNFSPLTNTHIDVLEKGLAQMSKEMAAAGQKETSILPLLEIVLPPETSVEELPEYIARLDQAAACGIHVLISDFPLHYQLKHFIRTHTKAPMAIVMNAAKLEGLFEEKHYQNLEGGLLEGLGKLFDENTKVYVYPHKTENMCVTAKVFSPRAPLDGVYDLFRKKGQITDISGCDETGVYVHSREIRRMLDAGDAGWEKFVPAAVAKLIKK